MQRSRSVWDRYWRRRLSDIQEQYYFGSGFRRCDALPRLQALLGGRMRRVLFAGSGNRLDPYYYAHLGYQVTVVDISRVAMEWVKTVGERRDIAAWFYEVNYASNDPDGIVRVRMDLPRSREEAAQHHVPGGSTRFIAADMLKYEPEAPFDAIVVCRAIGDLPEEEQLALARRFYDWLLPGGVCWTPRQGSRLDTEIIARTQETFREAGFVLYLTDWNNWWEGSQESWYEASPEDREKRLRESHERREREEREQTALLAAGVKLAVCIHQGCIARG